ncbi:flagellar brake protein [Sutcliffiella cohnii]|uniref:flagellar brake protein n=1 Tax=Sutcliffiella cohnii TaxID=33932 RepID=UPI002E1F4941|nr:flagellar brake domain-containing protein [Sutcliffiella cohnii]
MMNLMFKEGMVLTLTVKKDGEIEEHRCKIQIVKAEELLVDYPIHIKTGKTAFLLNGTKMEVSYVAEDGNVYKFLSTVVGRVKQNIPLIKITRPENQTLKKIQRREYVRIESSVDVAIHPQQFAPFVATTHDISAGGCSINIPIGKRLQGDSTITIWFTFTMNSGEIIHLKLEGTVIRVFDGINEKRKRASIQFINMKESDRDIIIKYCFEQQINSKRKSLY